MKRSKKYYKNLDIIRIMACIAVLLYHLNILKGGYLAVCTFFCLSSYLSVKSAYKNKKFNLKDYYKKLLKNIYIPLIIVIFITTFVISFVPNINYFNLKPEITSILFGYNNFWQLNVNFDYFARHINSPFMHLWYISILLQFDILFPFIFMGLKKIQNKTNKAVPVILMSIISIICSIYFVISCYSTDLMVTYYNTFTRAFSLMWGVTLGIISNNYGNMILERCKKKNISKKIYYIYIAILILLFIFIDSTSKFMPISMILTTIITLRLIDYSTINASFKLDKESKILKSLSRVSYFIYLVQYPVIFLFQYISLNKIISTILIIVITILISYILNYSINGNKKKLKYLLLTFVIIISSVGCFKYITTKDYTKDMKKLENQLAENQKLLEEKQDQYNLSQKQEEEKWLEELSNLEDGEEKLKSAINDISIVGVGDSVMLGAIQNLYNEFPNGYFDAKVSRTAWVVNGILEDLKNKNILGDVVLLNLGANGDCDLNCKIEIIKTCDDRKIFWINTTNDTRVNEKLDSLSKDYNNLYIIDWNKISKGHSEYFVADGIHLTKPGREAYTKAIYDSIYDVYLNEYKKQKEEIINNHEEELKTKVSFYGNDLLLNIYDYMEDEFSKSKTIINKDFTYETLKEELIKSINDNTLNYKVVFAFDKNINMNKGEFTSLIELLKDYKVYVIYVDKPYNYLLNLSYENLNIVNFYDLIKSNSNYLMADLTHLTKDGNNALSEIIKSEILN